MEAFRAATVVSESGFAGRAGVAAAAADGLAAVAVTVAGALGTAANVDVPPRSHGFGGEAMPACLFGGPQPLKSSATIINCAVRALFEFAYDNMIPSVTVISTFYLTIRGS